MGSGRLYRFVSTWLRVTAVGWLLTISASTSLNILTEGLTPVGTYLLPLMLMAFTLVVSGQALSCEGKPYIGAFAAALLIVALVGAVPEPMGEHTARTIIYLSVSVVVMLLFVHGALDVRQFPVWGSIQLLAPFTAVVWGLSSGYGNALAQSVVGEALPALLMASVLAAAAFSVVFEVLTAAAVPAEG